MPRSDAALDDASLGVSLGRSVREARVAANLSMRALASRAEISQPFLSQIESGQTMPSLITLYRLAGSLGISPSALLPAEPDERTVKVTRRADAGWSRVAEVEDAAVSRVLSAGKGVSTRVSEYRVEPGRYLGDWFQSDGELTVFVADGEVRVEVEGLGGWNLEAGDSVSHPGSLRNRWSLLGDRTATILLVYAV